MATTNDPLNGLLAIRDGFNTARWNFDDAIGSSTTAPSGTGNSASVSFSFLTVVPGYYGSVPPNQQITGFRAFSTLEKQVAREVIASFSNVVNLQFTELAQGGQISFAMESQSSGSGYAYYPGYGYSYSVPGNIINSVTEMPIAGDVWLNSNSTWTTTDFAPGNHGYGTLVHEIGHALGLKHSFAANSAAGYVLDGALDNTQYTVMSYNEHPHSLFRDVTTTQTGYGVEWHYIEPETLMPFDMLALQYLYGANTGYNAGNNSYGFETNRPFIKTIWDGGGIDTISVANFTLGCKIDLRAGNYSSIRIPSDPMPVGGTDPYTGIYDGTDNLAIAYNVIIENATGGSGDDTLIGNNVANTLNGGSGKDTMSGGDGSDTYVVDNIADVISETNVAASGGVDQVNSYLSSFTLGANLENLRLMGNGVMNGNGNALNNVLYANSGKNTLDGGVGADTVSYLYGATAAVTVSLAVSTAQATGGSGSDTLISIENLAGSNYNDNLTGNPGNNVLDGGLGNDILIGGMGNDTYVVNALTDTVVELATQGSDLILSSISYDLTDTDGMGNNGGNVESLRLTGSAAINATGNGLNNTLYANTAANILTGGAGSDTVSYQYGANSGVSVDLGNTAMQVTTGSGSDTLISIESLIGSGFNDSLTGNSQNNVINGGVGNDILKGNDGNDSLIGGAGKDTLSGGTGNDIFDFNALAELGLGATRDVITDFTVGQDKIDLATIDTNSVQTGDQAFVFVGSFTNTAGQVRYSAGIVYLNTDTDTAAEYEIQLTGSVPGALTAANFVL